jgi:hypothetical protein
MKKAHEIISTKKRLKREEDARLAKELKEISLQKQYMNANAAMVEYKQWEGLEKGKERQISENQNNKLIEQSKVNGIKVQDMLVRAEYSKNQVLAKVAYDHGYLERLGERKKENEVLHKKTLEYRSGMHEKQKEFEQQLRESRAKRYPFIAKINEESMEKARSLRKRRNTVEPIAAKSDIKSAVQDSASKHSAFPHDLDALDHSMPTADDIEAKLTSEV